MEISGNNLRSDLSGQRELWSLIKAQREFRRQRKQAQEFVQERLGDLMFGVELSQGQQAEYTRRLASTAEQAEALEMGFELPDLGLARVPRERLFWQVGGLPWRAFPVTQRVVEVTPLHRRLQDRMAAVLRDRRQASPESARSCVHAVRISLQRGGVTIPWHGEDRVELSGWGQQMLMNLQPEGHPGLRLPPPLPLYLMELRPNSILT